MIYNNEIELMQAFRDGNEYSFKYIFSALHDPLLNFTKNIIKDDLDRCYDTVAGSFLKLWKHREKMETFDHIRRYMYVITKHSAIDELRLFKTKRKYQKEEEHKQEDRQIDINSFDGYEIEVMTNMILMAMYRVRGRVRGKVIHMVYKGEKTSGEIADQLGISKQTVLNHKTRAIAEIKRIMTPTPRTIHEEIQRVFAGLSGL